MADFFWCSHISVCQPENHSWWRGNCEAWQEEWRTISFTVKLTLYLLCLVHGWTWLEAPIRHRQPSFICVYMFCLFLVYIIYELWKSRPKRKRKWITAHYSINVHKSTVKHTLSIWFCVCFYAVSSLSRDSAVNMKTAVISPKYHIFRCEVSCKRLSVITTFLSKLVEH